MRRRRSQMENLEEMPGQRPRTFRRQPLPKSVLVLGATSAIAQAWMRLLAPQGVSFFLVGRNATHLDSVAKDLAVRGAAAVNMETADLDDTACHVALLERAAAALGNLDCAFIAHGVLGDQAAGERDFAVASASLQTNFLSSVSLVTWLANYFAAQFHGRLVVISSVAGDRGRKSNYIYGAAKAGLNAFLDGVRNRLDREGVQVLTVRPGFVATPMTAHLPQGPLFATPNDVAQDILRAIEHRRDVLYTPWFWRWIMALIRIIPEWKFKKMDL
ncbi:MAG TPA: SDR family oxidoreductase [Acidobacteriaceae bacterium]|nr:SDR family oxidoreductase [Acidobacteriaceae bacterium]